MTITSADRTAALLDDAAALAPDVTDLRHRLHQEPELGLELPRTQEKVLDFLDGLGLEISLGTGTTSVTAVLRGGAAAGAAAAGAAAGGATGAATAGAASGGTGVSAGPRRAVLLRGDMDALPVQERTGAAFSSRIDGAMHACGHDLHTAMLAGAAQLLAARREDLAGDVVFMFQPGEEGYDGASVMVREGVLDAAGPRVTAAYGQHVMTGLAGAGQVLARPGALMAASAALRVEVIGAGGHGSAPFKAKDPVPVAAEMVTALQTYVTRRLDVFDPAVITVGVLQAGTKRNVIPDSARLEATVRTFSVAAQDQLAQELPVLLRGIAAAHGLQADVHFEPEYPLTENDPAELEHAVRSVTELLGDQRYSAMATPLSGSEDFSRVLNEVPGAFLLLSATPDGVDPATAAYNHSPLAVFDDAVLPTGTALYARLAMDRLEA